MKIIPNYITSANLYSTKKLPSFAQNPTNDNQVEELSNVVPSYNVSKPISYAKIEDIKLPNSLTAHYYKLANGQKVVIVPKKGPTVIKSYVNTGSLNEPDKVRGISHYIEHNLFNGSEALGDKDYIDEVHKMGAYTNASTSFSVTDYEIDSNLIDDNDLEKQISLHAGMLQTPKFLQDKLNKEKKIVNSEINMYMSNDSANAETLTLKNLFNIRSTSPNLVTGTTDNIDALTRPDVVDYFNNNYYPANMVTVITGDVDEGQAMELVSKYFNSTKSPSNNRTFEKMVPINHSVRQDIISNKNTGAAEIYLGFAGYENNNEKDQIYLRAVNQLLFGLAHARIKETEQKYSTSINPSVERLGTRPNDKSGIIIKANVPEEYVESALKDIYNVIEGVVVNPPTYEEFAAIKSNIKKVNSISMQSSNALNFHLGMDFLNGTHYKTANYSSIIDNMTYDDFINTARKYYDLNKAVITVLHPKNTSKETIETNYKKVKSNLSFTGAINKTPVDMQSISQYKMPNNFDIVFIDEDTDVVNYSLEFFNKDKSPKKAAIADLLNDMFKYCGTKKHNWQELAKVSDINAINSGLSASTSNLCISGSFPVDKSNIALDMYRENILLPDLTPELFNNAVKHLKDAYSTAEPSAFDKYDKAIYEGTQKAYSVKDKFQSLNDITYNDVIGLYNELLTKSQGQIVVTGPFSKYPQLKQQIFDNTMGFYPVLPKDTTPAKCYKPNDKVQVHTVETNCNQAEIIEGYKFKQNGNIKDDTCIMLMNSILGMGQGSRLHNDLREQRHLAYLVESFYQTHGDSGVLNLYIKTTTNNNETGEYTPDNIKKSIDGFNENIYKIMTQPVTDDELQKAKKAMKSGLLSSLEMNSAKNAMIGDFATTPYGVSFINEQFKMIDNITPQDIMNTAKNIFSNKPIYSIAATKDALDANKDYLDKLR